MGFYRSIKSDAIDYCIIADGEPMISAPRMYNINTKFNSPVTIGSYITSCSNMFNNCRNFNQPITIPDSVTNCSDMFYNCTNFNQPITIPDSVTSCIWMFFKCTSLSSDIYFKGTAYRNLFISYMLYSKNNSKRVNIRYNSVLNNQFNVTSMGLVGLSTITWTTMTNGFYNTAYNIYCYYNYSG